MTDKSRRHPIVQAALSATDSRKEYGYVVEVYRGDDVDEIVEFERLADAEAFARRCVEEAGYTRAAAYEAERTVHSAYDGKGGWYYMHGPRGEPLYQAGAI